MLLFLSAVAPKVVGTPLPTPSPTPSPVVQQVIQVVPTVPDYVVQGALLLALGALGWFGSWLHSVLKANKDLSEKVNVLLTMLYGIVAPAGAVLGAAYAAGDLDTSTPIKAVASAGVVLMASWLRYNGAKLTKPSQKSESTVLAAEAAA